MVIFRALVVPTAVLIVGLLGHVFFDVSAGYVHAEKEPYRKIIERASKELSRPAFRPQAPEEIYRLGRIEASAGRWLAAEAYFRSAIAIEPNFVPARALLAALLLRNGELEAAFNELNTTLKLDPYNHDALQSLGVYFVRRGESEKAEKAFALTVAEEPLRPLAHFRLGDVFLLRKKHSKAAQAFRKELVVNPSYTLAELALGVSMLLMKEHETAGAVLEHYISREPVDPLGYTVLSLVYFENGRIGEAQQAALRALSLDRKNPGAQKVLARTRKLLDLGVRVAGNKSP